MKRTYSFGNSDEMKIIIKRQVMLENKMDNIELDFATYNIDLSYTTLMRIFLHPEEKDFTPEQIVILKKAVETEFQFKDKTFPKNTSDYDKQKYIWMRDFREEEGTFMLKRDLGKYIADDCSLMFFIEDSPKLNCRLEKKKVTREVYGAICE